VAITGAVTTFVDTAGSAARSAVFGQYQQGDITTASGPTLALEVDQGFDCGGSGGWVFPMSVEQAMSLPPVVLQDGAAHPAWQEKPESFGALPKGPIDLYIYASSGNSRTIVLRGLRFHGVARKPPVQGTQVNYYDGCGGGGTYQYGEVDLTRPAPYWTPVASMPLDQRAEAVKFPYTVSPGDDTELWIHVTAPECDCQWYAELDWVDGTKIGSSRIDDHGHPFEMTESAANGRVVPRYAEGGGWAGSPAVDCSSSSSDPDSCSPVGTGS